MAFADTNEIAICKTAEGNLYLKQQYCQESYYSCNCYMLWAWGDVMFAEQRSMQQHWLQGAAENQGAAVQQWARADCLLLPQALWGHSGFNGEYLMCVAWSCVAQVTFAPGGAPGCVRMHMPM